MITAHRPQIDAPPTPSNKSDSDTSIDDLPELRKLPFEEAITHSPTKSPTRLSPSPSKRGKKTLFDMLYFCRKHPYLEITTQQLPEGSIALAKAEAKAQGLPYEEEEANKDSGMFSSALKSLSSAFSINPLAQAPGSSRNVMKTVVYKKLKSKLSSWAFPSRSLVPGDLPDHEQPAFKKEMDYLLENSFSSRQRGLVGEIGSEAVEAMLNSIFFTNYSSIDEHIYVVPIQKPGFVPSTPEFRPEAKSLKELVNPDLSTFNIVYVKKDFTVLDGGFYTSEVFLCIRSSYPFFSFYARFLSKILCK